LYISLFKQLKLDICDYNKVADERISICKYHERKLQEVKNSYESKYAIHLYKALSSESIYEKQRFDVRMGEYRGLNILFEDSIKIDVKSELFIKLNINLDSIKEEDLNKIYFQHKQELKKLLDINDYSLGGFLANLNYDSLLYFGEYAELQKQYKKYIKNHKETEEQYIGQNLEDIANEIIKNGYEFEDIDNPTIVEDEDKGEKERRIGATAGFSKNKNAEKIGIKGERYVFELLKIKYKDVEWVSENAKLDDVNAQGGAGTGYDMSYLDENEKRVYVEVKASTGNEQAFYMSSNELVFAEDNAENYELVLVTNINEDRRKFNRYRRLFTYSADESRYKNPKFNLHVKEYRIQTSSIEEGMGK